MTVEFAGLRLSSPVLVASGCAGTGAELQRFTSLSDLGAVVTRSITLSARPGGPLPRLVESPSGIVNSLGLPGPGVEDFVGRELPELLAAGATVIVSVWGESAAEYGKVAQRLRQVPGVAGIEVNVSHPAEPAVDAAAAVHQVRRNSAPATPVIAKLGPEAVVATARACAAAGADAVALINAVPAVPMTSAGPALGAVLGGLSGPAIQPIALRAVWQVHEAIPDLPIVGCGGITTGTDAARFRAAGATVVAVGSALLTDPSAGARVAAELAELSSPDHTSDPGGK